ncbi:MAG: protein kinase [Chloroflexi bacterium]|nr:protein kinase [Chloroflexota bacterium]
MEYRGQVLVVEDDPFWQDLMRETLEEEYHVIVAATYDEAKLVLEKVKHGQERIDLVTVDMQLPGQLQSEGIKVEAGQRIVNYLSRFDPHIPCIVVTGLPDISTTLVRDLFKRYNVFDFIAKAQFDLGEFLDIVERAIDHSRPGESQGDAPSLAQDGKRRIGRYEIIKELGQGAMGIVYQALDPNIQRTVALKVLRPDLTSNPELRQRFQREARSAGGLNHPGIVTIFDAAEQGDTSFLVMEYLEGQTLEQLIEMSDLLPVARVRDVAMQICDALDFAHNAQVIHRDIKPSNIILLPGDQVKLTDFGIAKIMAEPRLTRTGIIGTLDYMSPEQAKGQDVDHRADIYALGVVMFEMLVGSPPFQADNPGTTILKLISEPIPSPCALNPSVSDKMEAVIVKATSKDCTKRYQTAAEMGQALGALPGQVTRQSPLDHV